MYSHLEDALDLLEDTQVMTQVLLIFSLRLCMIWVNSIELAKK